MPTVAIVHDYIVERGGSERVLLAMHRAFPTADIHTAFFRPDRTYPEYGSLPIRPFGINKIPLLRDHHRVALPALPTVFGRVHVDADVVLCGTSGWSAGVRTRGRKVLYIHAPTRWLHDQDAFLAGRSRAERLGLRAIEQRLRRWDARAVASADRYLVPSVSMADQVHAIYGIDSEVIPPPVTIDAAGTSRPTARHLDPGFVLYAGRLVANKNLEVVIDAFRRRPTDQLVIAGSGPAGARLQSTSPTNVTFLGSVDDDVLRWLFTHCRAVVSASHESFGLLAVEAAVFGRPAVVLDAGGFLDTVIDGVTGVRFALPDARAIGDAIDRLDALDVDADRLRVHASSWSQAAFVEQLRRVVAEESGASS